MKRIISIILLVVLLYGIMSFTPFFYKKAYAISNIKIGDYVQMGRYYDESILWRCVDIDENGPLMLSDKILCLKPFDAAGVHQYLDSTIQADSVYNGIQRTKYGSNLWETSNLRSWLNSTETSGAVTWIDNCPPTPTNVWNGYNDYASEKGFIANGNFAVEERNAIKLVTQKSIIDSVDVKKLKVGGTAKHNPVNSISQVVQNFDTAYYHNVTDKVFLLDVKQAYNVYQNSNILGNNYYIGQPTQKAVDNSEYKSTYIAANKPLSYFLRTPFDLDSPSYVRYISSNGNVDDESAYRIYYGVRPAFYLNLSTSTFKYAGVGSLENPYSIADCDILSATIPANATIGTNTIFASVSNATNSIPLNITTSPNATWKLYSDLTCTNEIANKVMTLDYGSNMAYIKVIAEDNITVKIYIINIVRSINECDILNSLAPENAIIGEDSVDSNVTYTTTSINVDVTTSPNATWKLFSDSSCIAEIQNKIITLSIGQNYYYIKVTAQDGTTYKIYKLTVTRISNECDILSSMIPANAVIGENFITANVAYATSSLNIDIITSPNSIWKLYSDVSCKNEIVNKVAALVTGDNNVYVKVTAQDGMSCKVYTILITRLLPPCDVIGLITPSNALIETNMIFATCPNSTSEICINVTTSSNATWKLYSDASCEVEIANKGMLLSIGENTAFIKVISEYGITSKIYKLTITRLASNACNVINTITPLNATIENNIISTTVTNETSSIIVDVTTSRNSTWKLYSNASCANEIVNKVIQLNSIMNITYVKVIAQDGITNKVYELRVLRINIGDYIKMGKYYDEPILWRCVDIDENGPLMLSDKIITLKAFDAKGSHIYLDGTPQNDSIYNSRSNYGSNVWVTSNLRSWLNSCETKNNVQWVDGCIPSVNNVLSNAYANEKGFLAEGNFTESERNAIKSITQKSLLNYYDANKLMMGGTECHKDTSISVENIVQNYDTAYYQNVADRVFLLDIKQLYKVYQNATLLGADYYIGKPTETAVENSEYKNSSLTPENSWDYYLRSPFTNSASVNYIRCVTSEGDLGSRANAWGGGNGVRPAFYLNPSSEMFNFGDGSLDMPYEVGLENISLGISSVGISGNNSIGFTANVPVRIGNMSDENIQGDLYIVLYDAVDNRVKQIKKVNLTLNMNTNKIIYETFNFELYKCKVKAFWWDSSNNPICNATEMVIQPNDNPL